MACQKTWKSYQEQLDLIKSRGMEITDDDKALEYLERIGYYRLSGYWYLLREYDQQNKQRKDNFKQGACFHHAVSLYIFDKKLRLLLMDALERIEIAVREDIAHLLGEYDPFAYLDAKWFNQSFKLIDPKTGITKHRKWLNEHDALVNRSKEDSIEHYKKNHGLPLPIWVACEIWDFGALSRLLSAMEKQDQETISKKYGVKNGKVFASWLHSLNYLRNICAHHSRLWNRNIVTSPKLPRQGEILLFDPFIQDKTKQVRVYLLISIARHLVDKISPSSTWWERFKKLMLEDFPDIEHLGIRLSDMGTITDWQK